MFILPDRLARESIFIKDLPLSQLLLKKDARFLWMILVPRRASVREFIDLSVEDQSLLVKEINKVSCLLQNIEHPDKLNIGMIGNIVPDLHVHIIARHKTDSLWPNSVWGNGEAIAYIPEELEKRLEIIYRFLD